MYYVISFYEPELGFRKENLDRIVLLHVYFEKKIEITQIICPINIQALTEHLQNSIHGVKICFGLGGQNQI